MLASKVPMPFAFHANEAEVQRTVNAAGRRRLPSGV